MPASNMFGRRRSLMSNQGGPLFDASTIGLLMAAMPQPYGTNQMQLALRSLQQGEEADLFRQREQRLMEEDAAQRENEQRRLAISEAAEGRNVAEATRQAGVLKRRAGLFARPEQGPGGMGLGQSRATGLFGKDIATLGLDDPELALDIGAKIMGREPSGATFEDFPLAGEMIQKRVSYDKGQTWADVGAPYSRRDPLIFQPEVDPQTGAIHTVAIPRASFMGTPSAPSEGNVSRVQGPPMPGSRVLGARTESKAQAELRTVDAEVGKVKGAIANFREALTAGGGTGLNTWINNPRDPGSVRINMAYNGLVTALRGEAFLNTGVLQPGEIMMINNMLLNPTSLRGAFAKTESYEALFTELERMVDVGHEANRRAAGMSQGGSSPPGETRFRREGGKLIPY